MISPPARWDRGVSAGASPEAEHGGDPGLGLTMERTGATPIEEAPTLTMETTLNRTYVRGALVGGGIAAATLLGITLAVGVASGAESRLLLESSLPTVRFLASSVIAASATTLALLFTLLSLSGRTESALDSAFYHKIQRVALLDVVSFIVGVVLLLVLVLPISDQSNFSGTFYTVAYYTLTVGAAVSAGLLVSVILAIYAAVKALIATCWLDGEGPLSASEDEEPGPAEA